MVQNLREQHEVSTVETYIGKSQKSVTANLEWQFPGVSFFSQ
jgi:hypothetical protein